MSESGAALLESGQYRPFALGDSKTSFFCLGLKTFSLFFLARPVLLKNTQNHEE